MFYKLVGKLSTSDFVFGQYTLIWSIKACLNLIKRLSICKFYTVFNKTILYHYTTLYFNIVTYHIMPKI